MWFDRLRSWRDARCPFRTEAAKLITRYGDGAVREARLLAEVAMRKGVEPGEDAWRVVGLVERRLGVYRQADTATRWLETPARLFHR